MKPSLFIALLYLCLSLLFSGSDKDAIGTDNFQTEVAEQNCNRACDNLEAGRTAYAHVNAKKEQPQADCVPVHNFSKR